MPMPEGLTVFGEFFFGALWLIGGGFVALFVICVLGGIFHEYVCRRHQ